MTTTTKRRNQLIVSIYNSDPSCSMASLGRDFNLTRERVRQILKRYKGQRTCKNCYHSNNGLCAYRETSDMIMTPNKCIDWTPTK